MNTKAWVFIAAAAALAGCAKDSGTTPKPQAAAPAAAAQQGAPAASLPATIVTAKASFVPEGIEYDTTHHRFLVGSLAEGTIFSVATDGTLTPVIQDKDLVSTAGLEVDEAANRLYVANSDRSMFSGGNGQAKLGIYALDTGQRIAMVDLTTALTNPPADGKHFANDIAVDGAGNVYVTDTPFKVIYRVDKDHKATVFYRFDAKAGGPNGIAYDPEGYLISTSGPTLYKIPLNDPASAAEVQLAAPVPSADGMVWLPGGQLAVVTKGAVVELESDDHWASAKVVGTAPIEGQASTAAVVGDAVYIVKPHFNDAEPPTIERVTFE